MCFFSLEISEFNPRDVFFIRKKPFLDRKGSFGFSGASSARKTKFELVAATEFVSCRTPPLYQVVRNWSDWRFPLRFISFSLIVILFGKTTIPNFTIFYSNGE